MKPDKLSFRFAHKDSILPFRVFIDKTSNGKVIIKKRFRLLADLQKRNIHKTAHPLEWDSFQEKCAVLNLVCQWRLILQSALRELVKVSDRRIMPTFVSGQFMPRIEHLAALHAIEENQVMIMHQDKDREGIVFHMKDLCSPLFSKWWISLQSPVDTFSDLLHDTLPFERLSN